jgi:hypothetical protein
VMPGEWWRPTEAGKTTLAEQDFVIQLKRKARPPASKFCPYYLFVDVNSADI